eukprot:1143774-Pelagomonas_calceolata.AAC.12
MHLLKCTGLDAVVKLVPMHMRRWFKDQFTPKVAMRGGALIKKWGRSSAASTAVSVADSIRSLITPTPPGDCFSSGVCSDGNLYGIQEGLNFSFPCRSKGDGDYEICNDFIIDDWLRMKIKPSGAASAMSSHNKKHLIDVPAGHCFSYTGFHGLGFCAACTCMLPCANM